MNTADRDPRREPDTLQPPLDSDSAAAVTQRFAATSHTKEGAQSSLVLHVSLQVPKVGSQRYEPHDRASSSTTVERPSGAHTDATHEIPRQRCPAAQSVSLVHVLLQRSFPAQ